MRTWNANLASVGRWFAGKWLGKISAPLTVLFLASASALAQPAEEGGEAASAFTLFMAKRL